MHHILVVEDDLNVRNNIAELLNASGYEVTQAENGIEAIKVFKVETPDLILCDIMMPIMDGLEFYSVIREQEFMANIPFIFLTAKADLEIQTRAMNLGVEDYLLKPFDSRNLLSRIQTRLEKKDRIDEKFNKLKDDISLYVPHELQTPIFPIIGYSEMILSEMDKLSRFEISEMVESIHKSALRLKNRMEKFNKFAELRLQASEKYINSHNDFLEKSTLGNESLSFLCKRLKENIEINVEDAELRIAKHDLDSLLFELIENACKFSPENDKVILTGKKIENEYILIIQNGGDPFNIKLIEGFTQVGRKEKQTEGNGLGLAIISLIAQKYKLKIYSENNSINKIFVEFDC